MQLSRVSATKGQTKSCHPELKVSTPAHRKHLGRHIALEFRVTQRTSCRTRISSRAARPGPTQLLSPDHDDCLGNGCSRNMVYSCTDLFLHDRCDCTFGTKQENENMFGTKRTMFSTVPITRAER